MVEATGVEPVSEEAAGRETTCLGCSCSHPSMGTFARGAQNRQDAQEASPMDLTPRLRTESLGPAC